MSESQICTDLLASDAPIDNCRENDGDIICGLDESKSKSIRIIRKVENMSFFMLVQSFYLTIVFFASLFNIGSGEFEVSNTGIVTLIGVMVGLVLLLIVAFAIQRRKKKRIVPYVVASVEIAEFGLIIWLLYRVDFNMRGSVIDVTIFDMVIPYPSILVLMLGITMLLLGILHIMAEISYANEGLDSCMILVVEQEVAH